VKKIDLAKTLIKERALHELKVLRRLSSHPNVIKLVSSEMDGNKLYMFLEYATGGDLFTYVTQRGCLPETIARIYMDQLIGSVAACHAIDVVHHDIKLENILLSKDGKIKLSDFGLSQPIPEVQGKKQKINVFSGSPLYMAPEVFSLEPHDHSVDIWSLGVCLYVMVVGSFPFVADTYEELEEIVLFNDPSLGSLGLSSPLQDLLSQMLSKDPERRISLTLIKQHHWFSEYEFLKEREDSRHV